MSILNHHSDFLSALAYIYRPKVYVELGLYVGETVNKVAPWCDEVYGVDTNIGRVLVDPLNSSKIILTQTTTDDFFKSWDKSKRIDMAFIDADHKAESALRDLYNVLENLSEGGVVCMHDTCPISDYYKDPGLCGDSYKIIPILEKDPRLNIMTLPLTEAGISVITRKGETRTQIRDKRMKND